MSALPAVGHQAICHNCRNLFEPYGTRKYCCGECSEESYLRRAREVYRRDHPVVKRQRFRAGKRPKLGEELTQNETDVVMWIAKGKDDLMIAEIIGSKSDMTIKRILASAKVKLGANSRGHAVALLLIREGYAKAF